MLLDFLRSPEAYRTLGLAGTSVHLIETHHAWVFLIGDHALKMKKPVRNRWLNFSTPALREAACRQEWQLNQTLAPGVYLGLVQARREAEGWRLRLVEPTQPDVEAGAASPQAAHPRLPQAQPASALDPCGVASPGQEDWLVLMRRLPEDRMLDRLIERGALCTEAVDRLARVLCSFWSAAPRVALAPQAWLERLQAALAQHAQALTCSGRLTDPSIGGPPPAQIHQAIDGCRRLLDGCQRDLTQRVQQGRMVLGHGDLRPEHVHLPPPPGRPLVIDRLEFNQTLREVDPFEELAFLAVECRRLGAPWVGRRLFARCGRLLDDRPPHRLLRLYTAQRALLRARQALAHLDELPAPPDRPWRALARWYVQCACLATAAPRGLQPTWAGTPAA